MASITTMVKRLPGLQGTGDLTEWEETFVKDILAKTRQGDDTTSLTEKQIATVERIFNKNFAG